MPYSAWHIRTSEGETARSFSRDRHPYIFNGQPPDTVCALFTSSKDLIRASCHGHGENAQVFISSNRWD